MGRPDEPSTFIPEIAAMVPWQGQEDQVYPDPGFDTFELRWRGGTPGDGAGGIHGRGPRALPASPGLRNWGVRRPATAGPASSCGGAAAYEEGEDGGIALRCPGEPGFHQGPASHPGRQASVEGGKGRVVRRHYPRLSPPPQGRLAGSRANDSKGRAEQQLGGVRRPTDHEAVPKAGGGRQP